MTTHRQAAVFSLMTLIFQLTFSGTYQQVSSNYVYVNASFGTSTLNHFWKSTGFCPPKPHQADASWMLGQDMTHNLALIGSLPLKGIKQVRIHWLLDMVKVSRFDNGVPVYNYTFLDQLIANLWQNGLTPGFEIMGNPSGIFTDLENKTQAWLWKNFVSEFAHRYIDRFGAAYVHEWNFETWNEPENGDFDKLKFTPQGYMNYMDACHDGLRSVSKELKLGTPAGNCLLTDPKHLDYIVLNHVANGRSMFSGQPLTLDYIACHRKGEEPDNSASILKKEQEVFDAIHSTFPSLAKVPLVNDEADPLVGWNKDKWWRADATYAAMAAKVIAQHQILYIEGKKYNYQLLSNDNGFLSYNPHFFTQRTLLARFQINTTNPHYIEFIKKPIYSLMGMLSLLGEQTVTMVMKDSHGVILGPTADLGGLAAVHKPDKTTVQESWELTVMIYNSKDSHNITGSTEVNMYIYGLPTEESAELRYVQYEVDNSNGNPYGVWKQKHSPATPSVTLLQAMRDTEGPVRLRGPSPVDINKVPFFKMILPLPGVTLFHICAKPQEQPDQVPAVFLYTITENQVLITWEDSCVHARCVKTYEVEYSRAVKGPYTRINKLDTFFTSFVFAPLSNSGAVTVRGYYRIRAVDYWERPGPYSLPVKY